MTTSFSPQQFTAVVTACPVHATVAFRATHQPTPCRLVISRIRLEFPDAITKIDPFRGPTRFVRAADPSALV